MLAEPRPDEVVPRPEPAAPPRPAPPLPGTIPLRPRAPLAAPRAVAERPRVALVDLAGALAPGVMPRPDIAPGRLAAIAPAPATAADRKSTRLHTSPYCA